MQQADHSLVTSAKQDQRNVGLCGAESLGYFGLRHGPGQSSDFDGVFSRQQFFEVRDETDIDSVLLVHSVVDPLKVTSRAVRLHAVNVIDEWKTIWIGNEGDRDEAMDKGGLSLAIAPQVDLWISDTIVSMPDDLSVASLLAIKPGANSVKAPHSPEIADFVEAFKASNAAPFFVDRHLGSFERSAHFIAVFDTAQGG